MNFIILTIALIIGVILEQAIPGLTILGQAKPPVLLSIVIYYALNRSGTLCLAAALLGGVLSDSLSAMSVFHTPLVYTAIGITVHAHRDLVFRDKHITHMFFGATGSAACVLVSYSMLLCVQPSIREISPLWAGMKTLGAACWGLLTTPLICAGLALLDKESGNTIWEPT